MDISLNFDSTIYRYNKSYECVVDPKNYNASTNPTWKSRFDKIYNSYNDTILNYLTDYYMGLSGSAEIETAVEVVITARDAEITDLKSTIMPYITTVSLYNDNNELMAIAKFSHPLQLPNFEKDSNLAIIVEMDM